MSGKPEVFTEFLDQGRVRIRLDARRAGVVLPPQFKTDPQVVLEYGPHLSIPIEDMEVDGWGIRATLSFGRTPALTFIPWSAIWAIESGSGVGRVWADEMPEEVEFKRPVPATRAGGMVN